MNILEAFEDKETIIIFSPNYFLLVSTKVTSNNIYVMGLLEYFSIWP